MSYILEALKKSERERHLGSIAALQTAPQVVLSRRSLWLGMVIGAAVLAAFVLIAWLVDPRMIRRAADSPGRPAAETRHGTGQANTQPQSSGPSAAAAAPAGPGRAGAPQRVDSISQLDPADQARIQGLSLNVVSYSDVPRRRFIMVNQKIVHESESIGDGVIVKRIVPGGALVTVGKYEIMLRPN